MAWLRYKSAGIVNSLGRQFVAVRVELLRGKDLVLEVVPGPITIAEADVLVTELPEKVRVVGPDGAPIEASRKFWISTETIDPYHLLFDMER